METTSAPLQPTAPASPAEEPKEKPLVAVQLMEGITFAVVLILFAWMYATVASALLIQQG